jgi:hypothetical protein
MTQTALNINFLFVHTKAALNAQYEEGYKTSMAHLQDTMDTLLSYPGMKQDGARYLLDALPRRYLSAITVTHSFTQRVRHEDAAAIDKLIGFISTEMDGGNAALIKMTVPLPIDYIERFVLDDSGNLVSKLLDCAIKDNRNAHGLFCLRLATHQSDNLILNDTGYNEHNLPSLLTIRPSEFLRKHKNPLIRRYSLSNDLGM